MDLHNGLYIEIVNLILDRMSKHKPSNSSLITDRLEEEKRSII